MPQLGILFDAQKLGSGFYGYTAFRILFSAINPRELTGCTLYHGEVGDGRSRPYCIAIESDSLPVLARVRQTLQSSVARGLMQPNHRFLDESALQEEVLAMAAHIGPNGEIADCTSRWLHEAWQRAQGQISISQEPRPPQAPAARVVQETCIAPRLPDRIPLALRCSPGGRSALAWLVAFCIGGALVPWVGWGIAICAMLWTAGVVEGLAVRWRLWAESTLSTAAVSAEVRKLLTSKPLHEVAEKLTAAAPASSPLLRMILATTRGADIRMSCELAAQQERAGSIAMTTEIGRVRFQGFAVAMSAALSLCMMWAFQGLPALLMELPRLLVTGLAGFSSLQGMSMLLRLRADQQRSECQRLLATDWMPALVKAMPVAKTELHTLEQSLHELANEFQAMRVVLDRRRDGEYVETMAELRTSIDQLTPVLAGFREPFVLQAVPAARPKAMSATA